MKEAVIYLLAIAIAEVVTVIIHPVWGITSHILLLTGLIVHSALASKETSQHLLLSLALVPLIRIISLSMPLANIPQIWWYPIIYIPLLVAAFQVVRLLGIKREQVGLAVKHITVQFGIALTGILFGIGEYFILSEEAEITGLVLKETWLLSAFLLIVFTGFVEEFIFRGVLQHAAVQAFGSWGIVYVSLLFAIVHLIHNSILDLVYVFIIALLFGWAVKRTGSLLGVTLSHGIANIVLFLVMPLIF